MTKPYQSPRRIIGESSYDESGNLQAQQFFEVHSKSSSESIHRTVKMITRVKGKDGEFKEYVLAEAMAVFPIIEESSILMKHLSAGFKEYLTARIDAHMEEHSSNEEVASNVKELETILI